MMDGWRLMGQEEYLSGVKFKKCNYDEKIENYDHTHCEFCWGKIMEKKENFFNSFCKGYKSEDGKYWVCCKCFIDFKDRFNWKQE